jgi:hypothetical protein
VWEVWVCGVGGGFPLRSNIPRSALCATLDTYNFNFLIFNFGHFCLKFKKKYKKNTNSNS